MVCGICLVLRDTVLSCLKYRARADAYRVLSSLGYTDIISHLATVDRGQSLENVMVLTRPLIRRFNTLGVWFEPVEVRL